MTSSTVRIIVIPFLLWVLATPTQLWAQTTNDTSNNTINDPDSTASPSTSSDRGVRGNREPRTSRGANGAAGVCSQLDTIEARVRDQFSERRERDRSYNHETRRTERLAKLETNRAQQRDRRTAQYDILRNRATTPAQIAAVDTFALTVDQLLSDRHAAVDAAIADFESGVGSLMEERAAVVSAAVATFDEALTDVFADTANTCSNDPQRAGVELRSGLQAAREQTRVERNENAYREELAALRASRQAAITSAISEFQTAYQTAVIDLRAAFTANS